MRSFAVLGGLSVVQLSQLRAKIVIKSSTVHMTQRDSGISMISCAYAVVVKTWEFRCNESWLRDLGYA